MLIQAVQDVPQARSMTIAPSPEQAEVKPVDDVQQAEARAAAKKAKKQRQKANRQQQQAQAQAQPQQTQDDNQVAQAEAQQAQAHPQQVLDKPSQSTTATSSSVFSPDPSSDPSKTASCEVSHQALIKVDLPCTSESAPTLQLSTSEPTTPHPVTPQPSDAKTAACLVTQQLKPSSADQQNATHHSLPHDPAKQPLSIHPINNLSDSQACADLTELFAECNWTQSAQLLAEATGDAAESAGPAAGLHTQINAQAVLCSNQTASASTMADPDEQQSAEVGSLKDGFSLASSVLRQWTWWPLTQVSLPLTARVYQLVARCLAVSHSIGTFFIPRARLVADR